MQYVLQEGGSFSELLSTLVCFHWGSSETSTSHNTSSAQPGSIDEFVTWLDGCYFFIQDHVHHSRLRWILRFSAIGRAGLFTWKKQDNWRWWCWNASLGAPRGQSRVVQWRYTVCQLFQDPTRSPAFWWILDAPWHHELWVCNRNFGTMIPSVGQGQGSFVKKYTMDYGQSFASPSNVLGMYDILGYFWNLERPGLFQSYEF